MLSQFFVLSPRGDTIVARDYRGDVVRGAAEIFFRKQKTWKGAEAPPVLNVEGIHFIHMRRSALFFVAATKFNVSTATVIELLNRIANLFKDYCGILNEESLRLNMTLVYELLDEVLDFGYPQGTSTDGLRAFVHNEAVAVAGVASKKTESTAPSNATNQPIAPRQQQRGQKNEIFVDLLERLTVLVAANGSVLRCEIDGCIQMKSFLNGNPEIRLGLNPDLTIGSAAAAGGSSARLDDCTFHDSVQPEWFERERVLCLAPPDGEFIAMSYRLSGDFPLPFRLFTFVEEINGKRLDVVLKLRANMPASVSGGTMTVRLPLPKSTSHCASEQPPGTLNTVEYKPAENVVLWKFKKIVGASEQYVRIKLTVPDASAPGVRKEIGPVTLDCEVPMFICSGLAIRFLRVFERGKSYVPFRWVRYITRSDSYVVRM